MMTKQIIEQLEILKRMIIRGEKRMWKSKNPKGFISEHNKNLLDGIDIIKEAVNVLGELK